MNLDYAIDKFNRDNLFGLSTLIDLYHCDTKLISCKEHIENFVYALCDEIDMKRFGDLHLVNFGQEIRIKGYSFVQLIETSSIVGHFSESTESAYIDIFSCKPYSIQAVNNFTKEFFRSDKSEVTFKFRK